MKFAGHRMLFAADTAGTRLFALGAATAAIGGALDLLGLTEKALLQALRPYLAGLPGTVTAVAGGTLGDLFRDRTPTSPRSGQLR